MQSSRAILNSLRQIVRALRLNSATIENKVGLTGAQLFVLQSLDSEEMISINQIAERTQTDQSSVSVVVSKLQDKKLLKRSACETDRRKSLISLTGRGSKISAHGVNLVQERLLNALEEMSQSEQRLLEKLLEKLINKARIGSSSTALFFE